MLKIILVLAAFFSVPAAFAGRPSICARLLTHADDQYEIDALSNAELFRELVNLMAEVAPNDFNFEGWGKRIVRQIRALEPVERMELRIDLARYEELLHNVIYPMRQRKIKLQDLVDVDASAVEANLADDQYPIEYLLENELALFEMLHQAPKVARESVKDDSRVKKFREVVTAASKKEIH